MGRQRRCGQFSTLFGPQILEKHTLHSTQAQYFINICNRPYAVCGNRCRRGAPRGLYSPVSRLRRRVRLQGACRTDSICSTDFNLFPIATGSSKCELYCCSWIFFFRCPLRLYPVQGSHTWQRHWIFPLCSFRSPHLHTVF